ncbi:SPOR domain-containing protein [Bacteroidota bacterium]
MAYLGKYIRQILSRQEPVILPGFGSLIISQSAGVAADKSKIDPPGIVIKFDAEHPKDDGKLAAEYAAGENIDPGEAGQQVLELIDAIKFKMDKGEKYDLDLVGTFSRDDDNRVRFDKDPNWIIDPDLFGLPTLDLLELEDEPGPTKENTMSSAKDPATVKSTPAKKDPVQKEAVAMKKKMANRAPVNKWAIIWIVIGTLIIVLALILLIPSKNGDYGIEFSRDGIVLKENVVGEDLQDAEESNELVTEEVEQEVVQEQEVVENQIPVVSENNFFVIAGSFQSLQNASELMESLKAEGFPSEIIMTESRLYRVSVQSYPEKQQAVDDLGRIKAHPGLGSCWVWSR